MAILGFHLVLTLITLTIFTKFRSRFSLAQPFLCYRLYRYLAPTVQELREKVPLYITGKARKRKLDRDADTSSFSVPKSANIQLMLVPVHSDDVQLLPMYSTFSWAADFAAFSVFVYVLSETFRFFVPSNMDFNVSVIWILLSLGFVLQALANVTVTLFSGEAVQAERSMVISFTALFFLFSMMLTMFADGFLDIRFSEAYESFSVSASEFFKASKLPDSSTKRSPLLLFISLSVMFGCLAGMLVFPNFRYARMYTGALSGATPAYKLLYHCIFLSQGLSLLFFALPVKNYLLFGPRRMFTASQLESLRIWTVIFTTGMRVICSRGHLQSHLNLAADALADIRRQTGTINSIELQRTIFRYFSYLNVAAIQYLMPTLLPFLLAFLLKTLGGYSWIGAECRRQDMLSGKPAGASFQSLFNVTVQRGIWSLFLVVTLIINTSLSFIGVIYNSYFNEK